MVRRKSALVAGENDGWWQRDLGGQDIALLENFDRLEKRVSLWKGLGDRGTQQDVGGVRGQGNTAGWGGGKGG